MFYLHKYYSNDRENKASETQWQDTLGAGRMMKLDNAKACADAILGVLAISSGKHTLESYLADMKARGQDEARCRMIETALTQCQTAIATARDEFQAANPLKLSAEERKQLLERRKAEKEAKEAEAKRKLEAERMNIWDGKQSTSVTLNGANYAWVKLPPRDDIFRNSKTVLRFKTTLIRDLHIAVSCSQELAFVPRQKDVLPSELSSAHVIVMGAKQNTTFRMRVGTAAGRKVNNVVSVPGRLNRGSSTSIVYDLEIEKHVSHHTYEYSVFEVDSNPNQEREKLITGILNYDVDKTSPTSMPGYIAFGAWRELQGEVTLLSVGSSVAQ